MKKSIGKKLLAGIVSASMILGIPVSGYSQEEETQPAVIAAEESVDVTEAVLAGAGEEADIAAEAVEAEASEVQAEEDAVFDVSEEDTDAAAEAEDLLAAAEEDAEEEAPEDGILLEAAEEEILEAADDEKVKPVSSVSELSNAIKQVSDGYTIRLTQDISSAGTLNVDADNMMEGTTSITIDVSNYSLSAYSIIVGTGKTLTMTANGGSYSGRLNAKGGTVNLPTGMKLTNTATNLYIREGGTANVTGASIENSATTLGHAVEVEKGTLNLSAGSINVKNDDVKAILVADDSGAVVNMTGGSIVVEGSGTAVVMSNGSMTVTGGTIKNTVGQGVEVLGGSFTISKGTIDSKKDALTLGKNAGKAAKITVAGTQDTTKILSSDGYAIYEKESDYKGVIQVSGGYLKGKSVEISSANKTKIVTVTTDAVGFAHEVNRKYLPNVNCRADTQNDKGVYIIRTLTASNSAAAYIRDGETFYTDTVQEAMDVITGETYSPKTGDTVKLFKDVEEEEVKVGIDRTIDLNGHKLETKMTVEDCTVTVKNGTLQSYTDDYALVVSDDAVVTLESNLKVASPGANAINVGETASKSYKLTVKGNVSAKDYAVCVNAGDCTVDINSATLSSSAAKHSVLRVNNTAAGAKVTVTNSTLTGDTGIFAAAGEITLSGSTVKATGDQEENPEPGTEGIGSTIWVNKAKLTIKSGTFTSAKGNVLYLETPTAGSEVSAGTFKSGRASWDAVAGTPAADMFTGGTYYPNTKNDMKAGVKTAEYALVGVTGGTFYVGKYKEVVPALYKANTTATKLTVGAAAKSTLLYGFKAHAAILNLTGEDIDVLIGTDDTVAANKKTLPKTADTEAWIFHNDLVELKAADHKEATCTLPAVSADCWYCETLKKAYKASDAKEECDAGTITAAAKGHTWSAWNANGDRTCSVCGKKEHDASKVQPKYQIAGYPKKLKAKAAGGRKLTVSWKKPVKSKLKKIKGVQVQIATDKNFTNIVKTKKVKKTKTSFTFKLKKKTQYYVRVRFYNGSKYSKWSPVRARKTK